MCSRLAILALVLAVCQAFPQHQQASSFSSFNTHGGAYQGVGNRGGNALRGGFGGGFGGYSGGYGGGYRGGYNAGYNGGYNAGYNGGYNSGYNGGFNGGYNSGFRGGFANFGHQQQSYVAAVAPVAVAPVAKVVSPVIALGKQVAHQIDHFAPPHYQFEYAVRDEHTGDAKSHHEQREGDSTKGYYTVHEPDGTLLTVHYTVDKHSGFQAVVERTGHAAHPQAVKKVAVVAPVVQHAPVLNHY